MTRARAKLATHIQLARELAPQKYRAVPVTVNGRRFASKAEARRAAELQLLERAGEITRLEYQPRFDIIVNGVDCGFYKADFGYYTGETRVIEDVKGVATPLYKLKKRLVEAIYGIKIVEITKASPAAWNTRLGYLSQAPIEPAQSCQPEKAG